MSDAAFSPRIHPLARRLVETIPTVRMLQMEHEELIEEMLDVRGDDDDQGENDDQQGDGPGEGGDDQDGGVDPEDEQI